MTNWSAPYRDAAPILATLTIPGSKSVTNRALILAAIADSPSRLRQPLHSRDTELMIRGLQALGIKIEIIEENQSRDIQVTPAPLFGPANIDVGNAGTVMRFLLPIAALTNGLVHFDGDPRSHERPIAPLIKALEDLGASIDHKGRYSLPLTINGNGKLNGREVSVDTSKSSQFLSALMLVAPKLQDGLTIRNIGSTLPSLPHIEMTIAMLEQFGATVNSADSWEISGRLTGQDLIIEPDLSNAAPFMAAPMICGGTVVIKDWPKKTTQPGDRLREIFSKMGAKIEFVADGLSVTGSGKISGIDINLSNEGELTPVIAAVAALADTPSKLSGIGHLRLHETDRLAALNRELTNLGSKVVEGENYLEIYPAKLHGGIFHTYEDHRLATAGAVIGLAIPDIEVENIETTRKTLPDFVGLWRELLG
ncbi:MAG: 3-phosphoshikimate 1-carboxyvinyltransferase [Actinomycetales bacterium]